MNRLPNAVTAEDPNFAYNKPEASDSSASEAFYGGFVEANIVAAKSEYDTGETTLEELEAFTAGQYSYEDHMPEDLDREYSAEYAATTSVREAEMLTQAIRKKQSYYSSMSEHPLVAFMGGMAGGITSPEQLPLNLLLPAGAMLSKGVQVETGLVALQGFKVGAASALVSEAAMQSLSPGRTIEESVFSTLASGVFNGALNTVGHKWHGFREAVAQTDVEMKNIDAVTDEFGLTAFVREADGSTPVEVTAAAEAKVEGLIKEGLIKPEDKTAAVIDMVGKIQDSSKLTHPKLYKVMGAMSPSVRLALAPLHSARKLRGELLDSPLHMPGGQRESVSLMVTIESGEIQFAVGEALSTRYKEAIAKTEPGEPKLTEREFYSEVSQAMADGDMHPNIHVQDAAKDTRKALKSYEDRLLNAGLIKHKYEGWENVTPEDIRGLGLDEEELAILMPSRTDWVDELIAADTKSAELQDRGNTGAANMVQRKVERLVERLEGDRPVDQDMLRELSDEHLSRLHENGRLSKIAAEPMGDMGYLHRKWDTAAVNKDPNAFVDMVEEAFTDAWNKAHSDGSLAKQIRTKQDEIKKRQADVDRIGATDKNVKGRDKNAEEAYRTARNEKREQVSERFHKVKSDKNVSLEERARLAKELHMASKTFNSKEQLLANAKAELARLLKVNDEKLSDVAGHIRQEAIKVKDAILHQDYRSGFRFTGLESVTLKGRSIEVPYKQLKGWLEQDAREIWGAWSEKMLPDLLMAERFGGKNGINKHIEGVLDDFDVAINKANGKDADALNKQKAQWKNDISAAVEMIHNRFGLSDRPDGILHKTGQYARWMNMLSSLGMMTVSAGTDIGSILARHLMDSLRFKEHIGVISWSKEAKQYKGWLESVGMMGDIENSMRMEAITLQDAKYSARNKGDKFMRNAMRKFTMLTGMNHWNAYLKRFVAGLHGMSIVRGAHLHAKGKLKPKDLLRYKNAFIHEEDLMRIAALTEDGKPPDVTNWPEDLRTSFTASVFREAENTIVTPQKGDLPLVAHNDLGKIVFQFKSFAIASNHRLLMTSIDDFTAEKLIGIASMVALGHVVNGAKRAIRGEEADDRDWNIQLGEAIGASGVPALFLEADKIAEMMTAGNLGAMKAMGMRDPETLQYMQRSTIPEYLFGPSAGLLRQSKDIATAFATGQWQTRNIKALRRTIPLNNWAPLYIPVNKLEELAIERWAK